MKRQQKEIVISDLRRMMTEAQATFLVNYQGMSVPLLQGFRKNLRSGGSKFKVAKATLMKIAASDLQGSKTFSDSFKDQVGLVFVDKDVSGAAKQLVSYAKDHEALKIIAGYYESKLLSKQELMFLASLPSKEVLIAQLLGTMQAPVTSLVRVLHLIIAQLLYALKEIESQKEQKK